MQEIELKIVDKTNVSYDLKENIHFKSNLGNIKITPQDALEIAHALFDATGHLTKEIESVICDIDEELK